MALFKCGELIGKEIAHRYYSEDSPLNAFSSGELLGNAIANWYYNQGKEPIWLASSGLDNTIKIWDIDTEALVSTINSTSSSESLVLLFDGSIAAVDGTDIRIFEVYEKEKVLNKPVRVLKGHKLPVLTLLQLSDGRLASGSLDNTIRIWDIESATCECILDGHSEDVSSLAQVSHSILASGSEDCKITLWNLQTRVRLKTLEGHLDTVSCLLKVSEHILASSSLDNSIRIWNLDDGTSRELKGHLGEVYCIRLLPNGCLISCR
jgi:WD40 repeat protein